MKIYKYYMTTVIDREQACATVSIAFSYTAQELPVEVAIFDGKRQLVDGVVKLNGQAIKLHGINRHDSDPVTGAAISLSNGKGFTADEGA